MDSVGVAWAPSILAAVWRRGMTIMTSVLACSGPPPPAPAAVINATPAAVCVGDAFRTPIHLDSRGTAPSLTLVYTVPDPDAGAVKLAWSFSGVVCLQGFGKDQSCANPGYDVIVDTVEPDGTVDADDVFISVAGNVPTQVTLRVTNAAGGVTETQSTIAITPLDAGVCPL